MLECSSVPLTTGPFQNGCECVLAMTAQSTSQFIGGNVCHSNAFFHLSGNMCLHTGSSISHTAFGDKGSRKEQRD